MVWKIAKTELGTLREDITEIVEGCRISKSVIFEILVSSIPPRNIILISLQPLQIIRLACDLFHTINFFPFLKVRHDKFNHGGLKVRHHNVHSIYKCHS